MSKLSVLIGAFGTGKSTTFAEVAKSIKGKCLILDPGGAPAYASFPQMPAQNAWRFQNPKSQGKIWRIEDTGDRSFELGCVFGYDPESQRTSKTRAYLNGNLFLEDAGAYLDSNLKRTIKTSVKAFKQHGLNLFLSYHSIDEISTDVLRMSPSILFLKKTGDVPVFSQISKARKLGNYNKVMEGYYKARFRGMSPNEIYEALPYEALFDIARDLKISIRELGIKGNPRRDMISKPDCLKLAKQLCKFSNGKIKIGKGEKETGRYHTETIILR